MSYDRTQLGLKVKLFPIFIFSLLILAQQITAKQLPSFDYIDKKQGIIPRSAPYFSASPFRIGTFYKMSAESRRIHLDEGEKRSRCAYSKRWMLRNRAHSEVIKQYTKIPLWKYFYLPIKHIFKPPPRFIIATMQKGGTHLIKKLFHILEHELGIENASNSYTIHFNSETYEDRIDAGCKPYLNSTKIIILIRDLRDVIVSYLFYAHWNRREILEDPIYRDPILTDIIQGVGKPIYCQADIIPQNIRTLNIFRHFDAHVVKFENLIGDRGGGSIEAQVKEIQGICDFLNISINEAQMSYITENLFGLRPLDEKNKNLSATFRSGQIGGYKKYLNESHLKLIESLYGDYLNEYGYTEAD